MSIISKVELASMFGMDLIELDNLIKNENLPHVNIGNKVLFIESSVISWLRQRELPLKTKEVAAKSETLKLGHDDQPIKLAQPRSFEAGRDSFNG